MKLAILILVAGFLSVGCSTTSRQAWGAGFAAGLQSFGQAASQTPTYQPQPSVSLPQQDWNNQPSFEDMRRQREQDELIRQQTDYYRRQNIFYK